MFPTLLLALTTFGCLYCLAGAIYDLYFSPLRHIPGPWYAAVSDFWLWTCLLRLRQCQIIHGLFEVYGPIVRIGPRRVVFSDVAGVKSVYCVGRFDKSDLYKMALECGQDHAFCIQERGPHAARRKTFAQHYTQHHILNFLPQMQERVAALSSILETKNEPVDCLSMFHCLMTDVLLITTYGAHQEALQKWASGEEDVVSVAMEDFPKRGMLRNSLPAWSWRLLAWLPIPRWRRFCAADEIVYKFVSDVVGDVRARMKAKNYEDKPLPLVERLLQGNVLSNREIIAETMGHTIAGADTTAATLSFLCFTLTRKPDIVKMLRKELDSVADNSMGSLDILALQELRYLNAVLKEGESSALRLYTAVPSLLERVVPHLHKGDEPFDLLGYSIPGGTVVGAQHWSLGRDPAVFPSPDEFIPERCLADDTSTPRAADNISGPRTGDTNILQTADLTTLQSHSFPFGFGSRICVGRHLALMMMQLVVAGLVRVFDIEAAPGTDEKSMEVRDMFAIFPAGLACKLIFHPRSSSEDTP
ncbi:cytochrome P450 [Schizophyllum commune Tattone D]|nr:cytochrome P450 [Schizophyllum commune Tattone D]